MRTIKGGTLLPAILCALSSACSEPNPQEPIYPGEVELLTDVLLVEGVLQDFPEPSRDTVALTFYDWIYDRHGVTAADLDALRRRYSAEPTLWQRASDSARARLDRYRDDLGALLNDPVN